MKAKILELNHINAFVSLENGSNMDISLDELPSNCQVGDMVNLYFSAQNSISQNTLTNDRFPNEKLFDFI